ncbi:hypothetical protein [Mycobacterium sp. shizuoka-1]|uniref:hypothetical protein n=1 Tax=Mycobacterium sp. shizuoka-1 TaxID=2039281 RepID=UPI000C062982|nr:hypothetical protein [Mycobacterium sp. shizuoka-1]GAY17741.1 hypothetical protein MSZK_44670 [Mycobacterium sp. shizuoka-1]
MRSRSGPVVVFLAAALAGCAGHHAAAPAPSAPQGAVMLNNVSVDAVMDGIAKANLPALNAHDVTAATCPEAGCLQATATDTVTILKFPSTGRAELYAAAVPDMLQVEDFVMVFAPTLTIEQKAAYGQVVTNAMR